MNKLKLKKLIEDLHRFAGSSYFIFILIRIFSIIASLIILRIILDQFSLVDFAQVQKQFGLISILLWLADFGMLNYAIILFAENATREIREVLSTRFWTILLVFLIYLIAHFFFESDLDSLVLIFAIFCDIYTDSLTGFRQIAGSVKYSIFSLLVKKLSQLVLILLTARIHEKVSLIDYAFALLLPSLLIFVFDAKNLAFSLLYFEIKFLDKSKKIWFQSGGTSLASFDIPILTAFNALSVIPIFVVSRKISNALGIFGSTMVPQSMTDAASNRISTRKTLNGVFSISLLVLGMCILIGVFSGYILKNLFNLEGSSENLSIFLVVLATIPIGVITSNLNAVLISSSRAGLAAATTYVSSIIYLSTIYCGCQMNKPYLGLSIAVMVNLLTEFFMQRFILRKELKNE